MPSPNQRLGEYMLLDRLGAGTFGEVWRARHHIWQERVVAIKIPTDPKFVRQLQQEGAAIQRLDHPGIVKPISFDPYAEPAYLVMELVHGRSLRTLIDAGPLPAEDAVAIMRQVLAALEHAHQQGVIHRDIKPENILIADDAAADGYAAPGAVRVTDFGLGQVLEPAGAQSILLSIAPGQESLVGTTRYMAPEQQDGADVDARADIYACGVIFFELLTGRRPAGLEVPSDLNPEVPEALDAVFYRAFARRERRYQSAREFADALAEAMAGGTPASRTPQTTAAVAQRRRASPWPSRGAVIWVIVWLVLGAGIVLWNLRDRERTQPVLVDRDQGAYDGDLFTAVPVTQPAATPPSPTGPVQPWQEPPTPTDANRRNQGQVEPPAPITANERSTSSQLSQIEVTNRTGAAEGLRLAVAVVERYPEVSPDGAKLELIRVHDATSMRRHAGDPKHVEGSHADKAIVGVNGHIMLWGIYEKLPKGRYLVMYRLQAMSRLGDRKNVCFLDVCRNGVTVASRRPNGDELPRGEWRTIPVVLTLNADTTVEYRFWPDNHTFGIDRIYVYRVTP